MIRRHAQIVPKTVHYLSHKVFPTISITREPYPRQPGFRLLYQDQEAPMLNLFAPALLPAVPVVVPAACPPRLIPALAGGCIRLQSRCSRKATRIIAPLTVRETHLPEKCPPMRLPISTHLRNQLKQSGLRPDKLQLHTPEPDASPGWSEAADETPIRVHPYSSATNIGFSPPSTRPARLQHLPGASSYNCTLGV